MEFRVKKLKINEEIDEKLFNFKMFNGCFIFELFLGGANFFEGTLT